MARPETLDDVKAFARTLVLDKPIPEWFFQLLDLLHEVEDSMTIAHVRVRKCPSQFALIYLHGIRWPAPTSYIRYKQADNLPNNWIAIGDSVMRVNPIYG